MQGRVINGRGFSRTMLAVSGASFAGVLGILVSPALPIDRALPRRWSPTLLWTDHFWQQISGYVLLMVCASSLILSIRKRWLTHACLAPWKLKHAMTGLCAAALFAVHTGVHFGQNLNRVLAWNFLLLIVAGAAAGLTGRRNRTPQPPSFSARACLHVLLFWSLIVLLSFHIFATYYF